MKYLVLLTLAVLVLTGCATATVERKTETEECKASYSGMFKKFEGVTMQACGANGAASKSQSDELGQALTDALIRGLGPSPQ